MHLTPGQSDACFLVSHGLAASRHRVCLVDNQGEVLYSFGDSRGTDTSRFNIPCYLAANPRTRNVFVADYVNRRVSELGTESLQFVRTVVERLSSEPRRLSFNRVKRRLYVGNGNSLCVVQL